MSSHAIVTGGSSGIGLAISRMLVRSGHTVTILARSAARLESARLELEACKQALEQEVLALEADVSNRLILERAVGQAISHNGPPSLLVTSAGLAYVGRFEETPIASLEELMAVNYFGSLYMARCVLPQMQARGRGRICFISSGAGLIGVHGYSAYSPTKFALRGLAEVLRSELIHQGVRISIAYPPDTDTPMLEWELARTPPETRAIARMAGRWSADAVAKKVLRGMERDRFEIPIGLELGFLQRFYGLTAPLVRGYLDRVAERTSRQKTK